MEREMPGMTDAKRAGANIRSLRLFFGETRKELAQFLSIDKTMVTAFEYGERLPEGEMLSALARHFWVTDTDLLYSDLTFFKKLKINFSSGLTGKDLEMLLPIETSEKDLENPQYQKAVDLQRTCYSQFCQGSDELFGTCLDCMDILVNLDDADLLPGAAKNTVEITLLQCVAQGYRELLAAAALGGRPEDDIYQAAEYVYHDLMTTYRKLHGGHPHKVSYYEMKEHLWWQLGEARISEEWSDFYEYFLALVFCCSVVLKSGVPWWVNVRTGHEMMEALYIIGNPYAVRLWEYEFDTRSDNESRPARKWEWR